MRIDLEVPYEDKDEAKRKGAKWDVARKRWFVVNPENLKQFIKWIPAKFLKPSSPIQSTLPKFVSAHSKRQQQKTKKTPK